MTVGMYESRILSPHRPRRYGLLQAADVTVHTGDTHRWMAGANMSLFGTTEYSLDLTACDFEVTGWDVAEGTEEQRLAFTSLLTGECQHSSGQEVLEAMQANLRAEHEALLPYILERELIAGSTSGVTAQSLDTLATAVEPTATVVGYEILEHAEAQADKYESMILVPLSKFASVADAAVSDGGVLRTAVGNVLVPHAANETVYVVPMPVKLDLAWTGGPETSHRRLSNTVEAFSTVVGLFEIHNDSLVKFDPEVA